MCCDSDTWDKRWDTWALVCNERRRYAGLLGHEVDAGLAENVETFRENGVNADGITADRANLLANVLFFLQFANHRGSVRVRCVFLAKRRLVDLCDHVLRESKLQIFFFLAF